MMKVRMRAKIRQRERQVTGMEAVTAPTCIHAATRMATIDLMDARRIGAIQSE